MVSQNETTAVATVDSAKVKGAIQAMFSKDRPGFEEGTFREDLLIPRVRMLQSISAEVQQDPRKFFAGSLINSVTKEPLPASFIPIKRLPNNWIRFNGRKKDDPSYVEGFEPGAIVWRSSDPKDPRVVAESQFGPKGEPPVATQFMNFLCYFEGFNIPLVLSFSKTSYMAGKAFWTMAIGTGRPMHADKYAIKTMQKSAKGNTFYVLSVEKGTAATADELEIGAALSEAFAGVKDVKVHDEDAHEDAAEPSFP